MLKTSTGKITVCDARRFTALREIGCICCALNRERFIPNIRYDIELLNELLEDNPLEIHHLIDANKRRGHRYTIPLCRWHHRGICAQGRHWANAVMGPSLKYGSRPFHAAYGSDNELLALVDKRIGAEVLAT